jgi:hypothetical protein
VKIEGPSYPVEEAARRDAQRAAAAPAPIVHARGHLELAPSAHSGDEQPMSSGAEAPFALLPRKRMRFSRKRPATGTVVYELVNEGLSDETLRLEIPWKELPPVGEAERGAFMQGCIELLGSEFMRRAGEASEHVGGCAELVRLGREERLALTVWTADAVLSRLRGATCGTAPEAALGMHWFTRLLADALERLPEHAVCYCDQ